MNKATIFQNTDHRSDWLFGERLTSLVNRVNKLENLSDEKIIDLASKFLLHSSKIFKVIFGIRNVPHLNRLNSLKDSLPLNKNTTDKIVKLYEDDFGLINESHLKY